MKLVVRKPKLSLQTASIVVKELYWSRRLRLEAAFSGLTDENELALEIIKRPH